MKKNLIIFIALTVLAAIFGLRLYENKTDTDEIQKSIATKILRFHILANSDSETDQELKLVVRDAIGDMLGEKLDGVGDLAESERIVAENLTEIEETAVKTMTEKGFDYGAKATLARVEFPEKSYGSYTFPAGEYEALEVTLGAGEGHNWWCVLYPNMCFSGSVYKVSDDAGEELKEVLSEEEYDDVFRSGRVSIRFKLFEYFAQK
jgi:stage II sporulation protein R